MYYLARLWKDYAKDTGKTQSDQIKQFNNCCNSDPNNFVAWQVIQMSFFCQFTQQFYELDNADELTILDDENISDSDLKEKIKNLCFDKSFYQLAETVMEEVLIQLIYLQYTTQFIFPS